MFIFEPSFDDDKPISGNAFHFRLSKENTAKFIRFSIYGTIIKLIKQNKKLEDFYSFIYFVKI